MVDIRQVALDRATFGWIHAPDPSEETSIPSSPAAPISNPEATVPEIGAELPMSSPKESPDDAIPPWRSFHEPSSPPPNSKLIRESSLILLRHLRYTFSFEEADARAWKLADIDKQGAFHQALLIRSLAADRTRSPIDFGASSNAGIIVTLHQKLLGPSVFMGEGAFILHVALERYELDFQFASWEGKKQLAVLKDFWTRVKLRELGLRINYDVDLEILWGHIGYV